MEEMTRSKILDTRHQKRIAHILSRDFAEESNWSKERMSKGNKTKRNTKDSVDEQE